MIIIFCYSFFRSSTICTYGRVKIGVACTVLFSILYNIPRFFEVSWIIDSNPDPDWPDEVNVTATGSRPQIVMTDLRQEPIYISVYITWFQFHLQPIFWQPIEVLLQTKRLFWFTTCYKLLITNLCTMKAA